MMSACPRSTSRYIEISTKTIMRKVFLTVFCIALCLGGIKAQAGMHLYAGVSANDNESAVLNSDGLTTGWHIGADLRLNEGDMYFLLGGKYTSIGFTNNTEIYSGDAPKLEQVNTRVGLGFNLFKISDAFKIRAKVLASIDYLFNTPLSKEQTNAGYEAYRNVNSTASAVGGLGVSIGPILVDFEYGYGIFNVISKNKDTKPTHYSLSAGIFF